MFLRQNAVIFVNQDNAMFATKILTAISISGLLTLTGCASKLATESPQSVNLSGLWVLNEQYSQDVVIQRQGNANRRGGGRGEGGRGGSGEGRGGEGRGGPRNQGADQARGVTKTPAMTTKEMTITQNNDSMGIAYPKHRYRDIDWGKTEFWNSTVNAGWNNDNALIVETKSERSDITETYQLDSKGQILVLIIDINGSQRGGEFQRVFTRKSENQ